MFSYFTKRLLLFVPTLFLVSLLVFALSKASPEPAPLHDERAPFDQQAANAFAKQRGLDKPAFYFNLSSIAFPDTLHKIPIREHQQSLSALINRYGNWPNVQQYYHSLLNLSKNLSNTPDSLRNDGHIEVRRIGSQLYIQHKDEEISRLHQLLSEASKDTNDPLPANLVTAINNIKTSYSKIKKQTEIWRLYVPDLKWRGLDNQYHHWASSFLVGEFGNSYRDNRPVSRKLGEALWWSLIMGSIAIGFILLISIPLGVFLASRKDSWIDRYTSLFLFGIYSLPNFWVATLLLVFFTTAEYGSFLDIFAGPGLGNLRNTAPFWDRFLERGAHLILPIFCLIYASLAFVTRQIRASVLDVMTQDFVRTARAKGANEHTVLWKHAFRNALFPLISMIAMAIPQVLTGSIIIEYIFSIPGMGRLMINSITEQDWPVVYTLLMFIAIITMIVNLVADFCYGAADPRVKFE